MTNVYKVTVKTARGDLTRLQQASTMATAISRAAGHAKGNHSITEHCWMTATCVLVARNMTTKEYIRIQSNKELPTVGQRGDDE